MRSRAIGSYWRRERPAASAGTSTLSSTVRHFSSVGDWNTMPTPSGGACTDTPSSRTSPALGGRRPATIFISVVLPQPLGPTMDTNSPSATSSDVGRNA